MIPRLNLPHVDLIYQQEGSPVIYHNNRVYRVVSDGDDYGFVEIPMDYESDSTGVKSNNFRGYYPPEEILNHADIEAIDGYPE